MPRNSSPNPATAMPSAPRREPSPVSLSAMPMPMNGRANASIFSLKPSHATSQPVTVEPKLEPNTTHSAEVKLQQPGVDETNGRHGHGRGRLHQRRQQNTREQPMQPGSRPGLQHALQRPASRQLEAIGQHGHPEQEQPETAQQRNEQGAVRHRRCHAFMQPSAAGCAQTAPMLTRQSPWPSPPACAARTSGSCRCWSWAARQTPRRAAP